jgi:hypothetical protein
MERARSIKRLIFLINYLIPLLIFIGAFAIGFFGDLILNGVFIFFLVLAFLILLLLNRKRYIYSYQKNGRDIQVNYYNVFFNSKLKSIAISDLSELDITKKKLIHKYSYIFQVKEKEEWIKYEILDAPLKNYIISNLPVASFKAY